MFFLGLWSTNLFSQTTISSEGPNYTGDRFVTGAGAITFVIQNTNTQPITLKQIDCLDSTIFSPNTYQLWYSSSSLSGPSTGPVIAAPTWTRITTGSPVTISTSGVVTILTNIYFVIPASTQYRFALVSSAGLRYSGATSTPSTFSAGGVTLKTGNAQIGGLNVGFAGAFNNPVNTPRFFTGAITFVNGIVTCSQPSLPVLSSDTSICNGSSATLNVTGGSLNDAVQWKWYTSSCGGVAAGTGTSLTVTPAVTTTYYVRGEGGCAAAGPCASVTVTVKPNPGTPTINPITPICVGSVQPLTINPVAITPGSVTVSSGAVSINIPDNTVNGVSNNLSVSGIPASATITGIDVRLNMTHTYIGDMIFNLKAPNGSILALDKYLTGTGGAGENFLNTIISSAGTADISSGTAPFTDIFKPDAINTPIGTAPVQNPAGFVSAATSFTNLYSVPNGTWTLAMADGGPADLGILTEWAITINYTTAATSYPATWSPASTLYNDAAATTLYDGTTPKFTVYAKPAITTTYSATSVNNGCVSAASATTTVVVNDTTHITGQPVNAAICEFGNTLFGVTATGTSPAFKWLVNDGTGTSYLPIANNTNYSGTTDDTLIVSGAPASWNGYKYRCIVTSLAPCAKFDTTDAAALRVYKTPEVTLAVAPYTKLLPGLTTVITASADSAATAYTWYKNGLIVPSATANSLNVTIDGLGIYKANVVDLHGCTNNSDEFAITDSVSTKLFIFPNPNTGQFQVRYYSLPGNVLPRILTIYDAKGAMVLNKTFTIGKPYDQMEVDFSRLNAGVYIVNLLDFGGKRLAYGKVVVK